VSFGNKRLDAAYDSWRTQTPEEAGYCEDDKQNEEQEIIIEKEVDAENEEEIEEIEDTFIDYKQVDIPTLEYLRNILVTSDTLFDTNTFSASAIWSNFINVIDDLISTQNTKDEKHDKKI
jgi:hypothetical protein